MQHTRQTNPLKEQHIKYNNITLHHKSGSRGNKVKIATQTSST